MNTTDYVDSVIKAAQDAYVKLGDAFTDLKPDTRAIMAVTIGQAAVQAACTHDVASEIKYKH